MSAQRTIVIVGAGFSGTLVAANLLKSQHWSATQIVLVERAAKVARGTAYAERDYPFLLNVPASRMSADPNSPLDFLNFAPSLNSDGAFRCNPRSWKALARGL